MTKTPATPNTYLMWFRRDLRLHDITALTALSDKLREAAESGQDIDVKTLFVITPDQWLEHNMSLVQMDFIFRTLTKLATSLANKHNLILHLLDCTTFANSVDTISKFCQHHDISQVFSNYEYEINEKNRDTHLTKTLADCNIKFNLYHDQCILPPNTVTTGDNTMYKVFTPFYKKWQKTLSTSPINLYTIEDKSLNSGVNNPPHKPAQLDQSNKADIDSNTEMTLSNLEKTLSNIESLYQKTLSKFKSFYNLTNTEVGALLAQTQESYPAGEEAASLRLKEFVRENIQNYTLTRDQPSLMGTSQLSAYLTIGAISPRLCYLKATHKLQSLVEHARETKDGATQDIERWISELAWRDFYRHVIVDRPDIVKGAAYKKDSDSKISWSYEMSDFEKWCTGLTGVPLVDAAMRCLNNTGFMHNRLRMVTAMFLTKDLFIDWRLGERYFMQVLIDGDFASNNGGWQWSASVGTDAAPYFRIMNPFSQARTHDREAIFIKTWLPELKQIDAKILHDEGKLRQALSEEGAFSHIEYPTPMVEHKKARLYAIAQFKGEPL